MTDLEKLFKEWTNGGRLDQGYGIADQLRCVAMCAQEDHPEVDIKLFAAVAVDFGFNASTARRCWQFVKT